VSTTPPKLSKKIRGPLRYYASIQGHELVTRRNLIPSEPDHSCAGQRYYKSQLGPLEYKIPPIVANRWRRVTFIVTSGDCPSPLNALRFAAEAELDACLREVGAQLRSL